jgi:hypothetical protein
VVVSLLAASAWRVPHLVGVTTVPTLRPDGTVLDVAGYDPATRLLFEPGTTRFPAVPSSPTRGEAEAALALLSEVICDFPFRGEGDKAVALAAVVTVVIRAGLGGTCPMFLFDAHTPASGKSKLVDIAALIGTGGVAPRLAQTKEEETEKRITAQMMAGDPILLFDNVARPLGGPALDAAVTAEIWSGRVLGKSERVRLPNKMTFFATGNNIQVKGDLARRALRCYLDPADERPEERDDFKHPQLLAWVRDNRPGLVTAALTVVRAYIVAGCPQLGLARFGGFEAWAVWVRAPLVWAGAADPVESQRELRAEADGDRAAWGQLLRLLRDKHGDEPFHASDVLGPTSSPPAAGTEQDPLRNALESLHSGRELNNRAVGRLFTRWKGRNVGGLRLRRDGRSGAGVQWKVVEASAADEV